MCAGGGGEGEEGGRRGREKCGKRECMESSSCMESSGSVWGTGVQRAVDVWRMFGVQRAVDVWRMFGEGGCVCSLVSRPCCLGTRLGVCGECVEGVCSGCVKVCM